MAGSNRAKPRTAVHDHQRWAMAYDLVVDHLAMSIHEPSSRGKRWSFGPMIEGQCSLATGEISGQQRLARPTRLVETKSMHQSTEELRAAIDTPPFPFKEYGYPLVLGGDGLRLHYYHCLGDSSSPNLFITDPTQGVFVRGSPRSWSAPGQSVRFPEFHDKAMAPGRSTLGRK
jgi:hypothetical protein